MLHQQRMAHGFFAWVVAHGIRSKVSAASFTRSFVNGGVSTLAMERYEKLFAGASSQSPDVVSPGERLSGEGR